MPKEITIVNTDDRSGYITKSLGGPTDAELKVHQNFGSAVKAAREFFGEEIVKTSKKKEQPEQEQSPE